MTQPVAEPVHAVAPDGRTVEVRPDKLSEATDAGYQLLTPEQFAARSLEEKEGLGGAAKAFAGSGASALTLGLSDVVGGAIGGDEFRENRRLREIANPASSLAGTAAGIVAPLVISGGTSLVADAAELAPMALAARGGSLAARGAESLLGAAGVTGESLLGRAALGGAKAAAQGAVEGGLMGAGQALSEAALAPGGDYDSLAQKLWAGGIEGAEFGAIGGGLLGVGGELAGTAARKIGGSFSAREALQDLSDAKALKSAGYLGSDIAKVSRENPGRIRELAEQVRSQDDIGAFDSLKAGSEKLQKAKAEAGETLGTMRKSLDEVKAPGDGVAVREVLDAAAARAESLPTITSDQKAFAQKVRHELDTIRESFPEGQPVSFEAAHDLRRTIDQELTNYGDRTYPLKGGRRPPDPFQEQMIALRQDLETEFENSADRVMQGTTPEFRQQYADAKARYGALKEITSVSSKRVGNLAGNRDISLTDTMAGLTGFATMGPTGILAAAANRALRSTAADRIVGKLAESLANLDTHIDSSIGRWVSGAQRAAKAATSFARSPEVKMQLASGDEQKRRNKEYFAKLEAVEREARSQPGTLVSIPGAPKIQEAAERVRRADASYLLAQAPVGAARINNPVIARIARQPTPDAVETMRWLRKVKTIEDPRSALKALQEGRLTTDHVQALAERRPALLQEFRRVAMEKITDKNADMAYIDRIQLGTLLGVPTDPSLRPESIAVAQRTYAAMRQQAAEQQQQPPGPSAPGQAPKGAASRVDILEEGHAI